VKPETRNLKLLLNTSYFTIPLVVVIAGPFLLWPDFTWSQGSEEEIETLEVIEIPGTAVNLEERQLIFPKPDPNDFLPSPASDVLRISAEFSMNHNIETTSVALDPIGKERGITTPVKKLKVEKPPFPPIANELNWKGTVVLRLTIDPDGRVSSAEIHTSSGHAILDNIALDTARKWLFEPKKNGEFPVTAKINFPVDFIYH